MKVPSIVTSVGVAAILLALGAAWDTIGLRDAAFAGSGVVLAEALHFIRRRLILHRAGATG